MWFMHHHREAAVLSPSQPLSLSPTSFRECRDDKAGTAGSSGNVGQCNHGGMRDRKHESRVAPDHH
jgi:hypothetical protein